MLQNCDKIIYTLLLFLWSKN